MGLFSGIQEAQSTQGGEYIRPGDYVFQVLRVKAQDAQVGNKKWFIAELKTLRAAQTDAESKPNGAGSECSYLVNMNSEWPEMALGNVKAFLKAAYGSLAESHGAEGPSDDDIDEEMADDAISEENPLAGVFVTCKAFNKKTKKGGDFTRVKWGIPDDFEELAELAS